jgi:hypothetical protein
VGVLPFVRRLLSFDGATGEYVNVSQQAALIQCADSLLVVPCACREGGGSGAALRLALVARLALGLFLLSS